MSAVFEERTKDDFNDMGTSTTLSDPFISVKSLMCSVQIIMVNHRR